MKDQNIQSTNLPVIFKEGDISFLEIDGEIAMTAIELGRHLGYKDPKKAMSNLYARYEDELAGFSSVLNLRTEAGMRDHRIFYEEGIYIVCMLAQTEKAREFRRRVAKLIKALRQRRMNEIILEAKRDAVLSFLGLQKKVKKFNRDPVEYMEDHIALREAGFSMYKTGKFLRIGSERFGAIDVELRKLGIHCGSPQKNLFPREALPC